jgi:hypothetical protein
MIRGGEIEESECEDVEWRARSTMFATVTQDIRRVPYTVAALVGIVILRS